MNKFGKQQDRMYLFQGHFLTLRVLLWPILTAWTLIWEAQLWPAVLVATLLLCWTQFARKRIQATSSTSLLGAKTGLLGVMLDVGSAIWMPLLTGGWSSPWMLDGLLVLAWINIHASQRDSFLGTVAWLSITPFMLPYSEGSTVAASVILAIGVPLLLWLTAQSLPHIHTSESPPFIQELEQLHHTLQRAEQLAWNSDNPELRRLLTASKEQIQHLQTTQDLQTPPETIIGQIQMILKQWQQDTGINVELITLVQPRILPPVVQSILHQALEVVLHNIQQHAYASTVEIDLRGDDDMLVLTVRDNGVGLGDKPTTRPGCHGLRSLRYRVQEINGFLDVFEGIDGGVVVQVSMPLAVYAL